MSQVTTTVAREVAPSIRGHLKIMRLDHWVKNVFVLPGVLVALTVSAPASLVEVMAPLLVALVAVGLVASSNYVINEVLDAPYDRAHPTKSTRPVPAGEVSIPLAYLQWFVLMVAGVALASTVTPALSIVLVCLWLMGCVYNMAPLRTKDRPYIDVLSEAVNNPLRMLAGWYVIAPAAFLPVSLLISYWMIGAYFMAAKRFSEYRDIGDQVRAARYRRSFAFYTEARLLISIMFYASAAMLFLGAFIMRYRLEMVLAFPLVAVVMAVYLALAFKADSAAQAPEKLYREPLLMVTVSVTVIALVALLFIDLPLMHAIFEPTMPINSVE